MKSRNLDEIRVTDCNRTCLNPLRAKYFRGNIKYILTSYIITHIDMTQVIEILPQVRQKLTYAT